MAITSAFQADDAGSIPAARSSLSFSVCDDGLPGVTEKRPSFEWALLFAKLLYENTDPLGSALIQKHLVEIQLTSGGLLDEVPQIQIASLRRGFFLRLPFGGLFLFQALGTIIDMPNYSIVPRA